MIARMVSNLHCEVHGTDGDWLIFVQGLGGHAGFWNAQIAEFSRDYRLLVYDHAGVGRSVKAGTRKTIGEMAADLKNLMDELEIKAGHIIGHSMGGLITQDFMLGNEARVKSAIIGGSFASPSTFMRLLLEFRRDILEQLGAEAFCRFQTLTTVRPDAFETDLDSIFSKEKRANAALPDKEIIADRIGAILSFDRRLDLPSIKKPVLIIAAQDDLFVPWEISLKLSKCFNHSRFMTFENGGHFFPQVVSNHYNTAISDFLKLRPNSGDLQ